MMEPCACECPCQKTHFEIHAVPKVRFYCHCTICQNVYQQPFSDFVVLANRDVTLPEQGISFHKMRPPPNLARGLCTECQSPVAGVFSMVPGMKFIFVPVSNIKGDVPLPKAIGHLFYHSRVDAVNDGKNKYNSYWHSQWAVSQAVFTKLVLPG